MNKLSEVVKRDREVAKQYFNHPITRNQQLRDLDRFVDNLDRFRPSGRRLSVPVNKMIGQV